ncbi:MAG: hypothetical protein NT007_14530 [Candidatus Kapabacteria bacterium]|nr:hypothetical protein [Candidatus Kapabacteria bacterium]
MKKILYLLVFFAIVSKSYCSYKFEFNSFNISFTGLEKKGDSLITYGDHGTVLISINDGESWIQANAFKTGIIVKLFIQQSWILAFNNRGTIAMSHDFGLTWSIADSINDSIRAVVRIPNGYFLRSKNYLITMDTNLQELNRTDFYSKTLDTDLSRNFKYYFSISIFQNKFIVLTDNDLIYSYDFNLKNKDSLSLKNLGLCNSCGYSMELFCDSSYFYFVNEKNIFRSKDMKTAELFYRDSVSPFAFRIIDNIPYLLDYPQTYNPDYDKFSCKLHRIVNKDSLLTLSRLISFNISHRIDINDFKLYGSKLYFVGKYKLIAKGFISDSALQVLSQFNISNLAPDQLIGDSILISISGAEWNNFSNKVEVSYDKGITFRPVTDIRLNSPLYKNPNILYKNWIKQDNTLYLFGKENNKMYGGVFISRDTAKTFLYKPLDDFYMDGTFPILRFLQVPCITNLHYNGNLFSTTYNIIYKTVYTTFCFWDKDFNTVSRYRDSNFIVDYLNTKDTNTFLVHCLNTIDTLFEIKATKNRGKNWDLIKRYDKDILTTRYHELIINKTPYLAIFNFDNIKNEVFLDMLNIETYDIQEVYRFKPKIVGYAPNQYNSIFSSNDSVFIFIDDTLVISTNIFDKTNRKYFLLPTNSYVVQIARKVGDQIFCVYKSKLEYYYEANWVKLIEIPDPKPIILVSDYSFGKQEIKKGKISTIIKIENPSKDGKLIISGISGFRNSIFTSDLPKIDSMYNIIINPNEFLNFNVFFEPKEVGKYSDSLILHSNALIKDSICVVYGEAIDTTTSAEDYRMEIDPYLYHYPPYPQPSANIIHSLIYWDPGVDIDSDDISVYDVFGVKIQGREHIAIEKRTQYRGILNWDCADVPNGVYLIQLKHGSVSMTLKVMVSK